MWDSRLVLNGCVTKLHTFSWFKISQIYDLQIVGQEFRQAWLGCLPKNPFPNSFQLFTEFISLYPWNRRSLFPCRPSAKVHFLLTKSIWFFFFSRVVLSILKAVTLQFLLTLRIFLLSSSAWFCYTRRKLSSLQVSCVKTAPPW